MKKIITAFFLLFATHSILQAQNLTDHRRYAPNAVSVKFFDGTTIQASNGELFITGETLPAQLQTLGIWRPVHRLPLDKLKELRVKAERNLQKKLPDPAMSFYFVVYDRQNLSLAHSLLSGLGSVERVLYVPIPTNALPGDFTAHQSYPLDMPSGINAEAVWANYGNHGAGIKICDIEYGFRGTHQDLPPVTVVGPTPVDPFLGGGIDHGTAVIGEIASVDNGFGSTGLATDAEMYFAGAYTDTVYDVAGAITQALTVLSDGDVILLEQQIDGPNYDGTSQHGLVPVEWYIDIYDAIVLAVGQNITVVEAAGNGEQDLDDPIYSVGNGGHYPFLPGNNSGAIIVGAGAVDVFVGGSDNVRSKLWYSNYGSRVDVQGNGEMVFTTGYGDYYSIDGADYWYTSDFGGTSGASPIVTGAVALMQSVSKQTTGTTLPTSVVRNTLVNTGKAQQPGTYPLSNKIGPLPDVYQAIQSLFPIGVAETQQPLNWMVFPNPGNGVFQLLCEQDERASLVVYDAQGREVMNKTTGNRLETIDLSGQSPGLYTAKYQNGNQTGYQKLLIQR